MIKQKILKSVKNDLERIEKSLEKNLDPYLELCREIARHIIFAGGKRIRPLLFVLSARICDRDDEDVIDISTLFEFLHSASLLHDDLVDESEKRRNKKSAHLLYGNAIATLVGDFLFAKSMSLACKTKKISIIEILSKITANMSQGEIHQFINKKNYELSFEEYLIIISKKTAYLLEGACKAGAIFSNTSKEKIKALASYGFNIGVAFQMADDILDYISDKKEIGKDIGVDIKEGKVTLPLIYAIQNANKKEKQYIEELLKKSDIIENDIKDLNKIIENYNGFELTKQKTKEYIKKAKSSLDIFEKSKTKETLLTIADYVLSRKN